MELLQLAIDTSTSRPAAAVLRGERCLAEWIGPAGLKHHETLLAGIDETLRRAGFQPRDLHFLSVGIGPGMFTGLRIGVTTAKFLADPISIPCVPVSSLVALAYQAAGGGASRVWAMNDAKSRRVYAYGASELSHDFQPSSDEEVAFAPEEVATRLRPGDLLIGEGALLYKDLWPEGVALAPEEKHALSAASVGSIGAKRYALGFSCTPAELLPKYLKTGQSHL